MAFATIGMLADGGPARRKPLQPIAPPAPAPAAAPAPTPGPAALSPANAMALLNPQTSLTTPVTAPAPVMPARVPPSTPMIAEPGSAFKAPQAAPPAAPTPPAAPPAAPPAISDVLGQNFNPAAATAGLFAPLNAPGAPGAPPAAPPGAPPAAPPGGGGSSSSAAGPSLDDIMALINGNPVLGKVQAENEKRGKTAASSEIAAVKNMLLGYGSQSVARQILEKLAASDPRLASEIGSVDAFTGATDAQGNPVISDNPDRSTSILAQLARAYRTEGRNLDEGFNDKGLFFSGARAGALNDLGYQHQVDAATQRQGLEEKLTAAALGLTNADMDSEQRYLDAYQNAYRDALDEALKYGGLGSGNDATGGGDNADYPLAPPGPASATAGMFAPLNNLTAADWAKIRALPINKPVKKKTTTMGGGGGRASVAA